MNFAAIIMRADSENKVVEEALDAIAQKAGRCQTCVKRCTGKPKTEECVQRCYKFSC